MNEKVSIIIPAYNVENYIYRAIESSIEQTYQNIEIVIIDDGSSDDTWKVIEKYKKIDKRIISFKQKNSGVSSARNKALQIATGDYVIFLDSDDWIEENTIENLINRSKENSEYLISSDCYFAYFNKNEEIYKEKSVKKNLNKKLNQEEALLASFGPDFKLRSSCYKLFSMKIIKSNKIEFDINIRHGEDGLFVFEYLHYVKGLDYKNEPLWNILERPGSATTSPYNHYWMTAIDAVEKMMELNNSEKVQNALIDYLVRRTMGVLSSALKISLIPKNDIKIIRTKLRQNGKQYFFVKNDLKSKLKYLIMAYAPIRLLSLYLKRKGDSIK